MRQRAALLIHYYFPPIHSIGCRRNYGFAQEWLKAFDVVKIMTTTNNGILPKDDALSIASLPIVSLKTDDYRTKSLRYSKKQKIHYTASAKENIISKVLVKAIHTYPLNVWVGEGGSKYIKDGIKEGTAFLRKYPEATIYSSFRPYADHAIAAHLKSVFPKCRWIADFRDADIDPLYRLYLNRWWQARFNRKILKTADKVITVSDGVTDLMSKYHHNVLTVPNGVKLRQAKPHYDPFTISYTGSLYGNHRDPSFLFKAVQELISDGSIKEENLQLIYAGKDGQQFIQYGIEYAVDHLIDNKNMLGLKESQTIQSKSHINLLLTSSTKEYQGILTGKLYEYMGAQNPILAIVKGEGDQEVDAFFDKYQLGYIHYTENGKLQKLKDWILNLYHRGRAEVPLKLESEEIKKSLSWKSQFERLIS